MVFGVMKKSMNVMISCVVAAVLTSCGKPTPESLTENMVEKVEEVAAILDGAEDIYTAKSIAGKIEGITLELKDIQIELEELGGLSEEEKKDFDDKYVDRINAAHAKMLEKGSGEGKHPAVGKILKGPMMSFYQVASNF